VKAEQDSRIDDFLGRAREPPIRARVFADRDLRRCHCIAGTSMGALVGATFAAGALPAAAKRELLAINWERTGGGQCRRDRTPINRKLSGLTYTNSLEFGFNSDGC
jgi:predicted acylesterase/phospholipase RssA